MGNCSLQTCVLPIEFRGVKLQVAKEVMNSLNEDHKITARRKLKRNPSPGEVIAHGFVKELANSESYAEYLARNPHTAALVGRCTVFLSHTWGSPFEETVAALEEYEKNLPKGSPSSFYFIDLFAVNQHDPEKDLDDLGRVVQGCESLLLLSKPWDNPKCLKRAWCVYEMAHAVLGRTKLKMIMPSEEKDNFRKAIKEKLISVSKTARFMDVFTQIESKNMKASKSEDLDEIEEFMTEKLGGFGKVNQTVSSGLRTWACTTAVNLCVSFVPSGTFEHVKFLDKATRLFQEVGFFEEYLMVSKMGRSICEDLKNDYYKELFMNDEANSLADLGRMDESVKMQKELIELRTTRDGALNRQTLITRYNLGYTYMEMKMWHEAEEQLTAVLNDSKAVMRPMSSTIRMTQRALGEVLRDSGKDINRAQFLFQEMLDYEIKTGISNRPASLLTEAHLARCLDLKGDRVGALKVYTKALPVFLKTWGEDYRVAKDVRVWINEIEKYLQEKEE